MIRCIAEKVNMPLVELEKIASYFEVQQVVRGTNIVKSGQVCEHFIFINQGVCRLYSEIEKKQITNWIAKEKSFITSLTSFVFHTPSKWNIQTLEDCELFLLKHSDHLLLSEKFPKWLAFDNILLANAFSMLEHKMFTHLYMTAEERYFQLSSQEHYSSRYFMGSREFGDCFVSIF